MKKNSTQWTSKLGFVLATAGAAVGLGNLWKFPYLMGANGGFSFLLAYLVFILILGLPVMIMEMALGRKTRHDPVQAYQDVHPRAKVVGIFGVLAAFMILSYYSVIGGWIMKYGFSYLTTMNAPADFGGFIGQAGEPIMWHGLFMLGTGLICFFGVKGIERASKFMMPALLVILLIIIARSVTLPNAGEGLAFIFTPKLENFSLSSISAALGQVFYSLSLCMGITITYGSYLRKEEHIVRSCFTVAGLDTVIAILAGIAIFPAVFSFGLKPEAGPTLIFETLPQVFGSITGGGIFALLFFILVFFAAVTSSVALLEVVCSLTIDTFKWSRKRSVVVLTVVIFLLGVPSSLSFGPLADFKILSYNFFDFMGVITDKILLPLGGIFMCYYIGWKWKPSLLVAEIEESGVKFRLAKLWLFCIRFIVPILVIVVTVTGFKDIYTALVG